jgi:hypothetical protein
VTFTSAARDGDAKVVAWLEAEQEHCDTSAAVVAQLEFRIEPESLH